MATNYTAFVFTKKVLEGGTDSDIFIQMIGTQGVSSEIPIDNPNIDDFEQGHTDAFALPPMSSLGKITQIKVRIFYRDANADWNLGWIKIREHAPEGDKIYTFDCNHNFVQQIGTEQNEMTFGLTGFQENASKADSDYRIFVFTPKVKGGGTNSDIYVKFFGSQGTSGEMFIDNEGTDDFEQGSTDSFILPSMPSLGKINQVKVRIVYKDANPSWRLGWLRVEEMTVGGINTYHFDCNHDFIKQVGIEQNEATFSLSNFNEQVPSKNEVEIPPVTMPEPDIKKPQLQLSYLGLTPDPFAKTDKDFAFNFQLFNLGGVSASNAKVMIRLFPGGNTGETPLKEFEHTASLLAPGDSSIFAFKIDGGLSKGNYTVTARVDEADAIDETNEELDHFLEEGIIVDDISSSPNIPPPPPDQNSKQVKWIRLSKISPLNKNVEIDKIGGIDGNIPWSYSLPEAVNMIENGQKQFFTLDSAGNKAKVHVDRTHHGAPFLRTGSDASLANNLRSLPQVVDFFKALMPVKK